MMSKTDNRLRSGCGCLLMGFGMVMVVVGILFAVVSYTADRDAGKQNRQEWADYEAQQPVIDSLRQAGVADSIIWEQYPQPHIRQGGLATFLGALVGGGLVVVALFPIFIGWWLRRKGKKKHTEDMKQTMTMIAALLMLTVSNALAQGIKSGTHWYVGLMEFEATVVDRNTVRMYSNQGGMELEFLLKHPANNWEKLTIRSGEDPDAFIIGLPEGTRCRLVRENGNDMIEAYDGLGALIDVFVKTPDDLTHNERMTWMGEYCGPYTIDCERLRVGDHRSGMGDCPNIGIGLGILEEGSLEIPWDIVMPRGVATQCINITDGTLKGTWAVFPTVEGLTLNRVEFDSYGMPIEQGEKHVLRWAATQRPRFGFVSNQILTRSQLEKYDAEALELMRNTIFAVHGQTFSKPDLKKYFKAQPWYKITGSNERRELSYIEDVNVSIIHQVEAQKKGYIQPGMLLGEWGWQPPKGMTNEEYAEQGNAELMFTFVLDEDGHLAIKSCGLYRIKEFDAYYSIVNKKLTIYDLNHPMGSIGDILVELELQPDGSLHGSYDLRGYEGKRMWGVIDMRK